MSGTHRGNRSRTNAARAAVHLRALARWAVLAANAGAVATGCSERERPDRIADPPGDGAAREVSGSFRAPAAEAAGGAGGAASTERDGGIGGGPGAGASAAGSTESGPVTLQQTYEATCDGSTVQWGFFTFRATAPRDSSIVFQVRTAATEAELASGAYLDLLTASAALGTDRCSFTGPAPCPIDLYELLGGPPLAHHPFAQLQVLLRPTSEGALLPSVEDWQLTYSCTFNQ